MYDVRTNSLLHAFALSLARPPFFRTQPASNTYTDSNTNACTTRTQHEQAPSKMPQTSWRPTPTQTSG
jgi:hypothetical protein